jgi:XTP/dITP diphosphohydrolase
VIRISRPQLLLATTNPGKRHEFSRLVPSDVVIHTLADLHIEPPPEVGATFTENADAKAIAASRQSGMLTLADDSGLEVAALGGAPGIRSARYAGEPPSDQRNRDALLAAMSDLPSSARAARFVCAVALARDGVIIARTEGVIDGVIATEPAGEHGFGYDPIFRLPDGRTMAELPPSEKNRISHRALAYQLLMPDLLNALEFNATLGVS